MNCEVEWPAIFFLLGIVKRVDDVFVEKRWRLKKRLLIVDEVGEGLSIEDPVGVL